MLDDLHQNAMSYEDFDYYSEKIRVCAEDVIFWNTAAACN
jgi:hypothetical protein